MENLVEQQLTHAAQVIENKLDAEIHKLDNMDDDDFDVLRKKRMMQLKKASKQKEEWLANGHGSYMEVANEKEFFAECKKSKNVVCHFYRDSTFRCKIVDKHLALLAPKHLEAKFMKINVEKCPFLVDRLRIKVIPTICIAKEEKTFDYIVGFDDLGGVDEFPTEMLEWRLGCSEVINYKGDLLNPPLPEASKKPSKSIFGYEKKKGVRGKDDDDSSDNDDW